MGLILYIISAILVAIGATYVAYRFAGDDLDDDDMPMAIGMCLVYGLLWPIAIPITLIAFLAYLAKIKGLKAYEKKKEQQKKP